LERRSPYESVFAKMAAEPGIHASLSDSETLKDAESLRRFTLIRKLLAGMLRRNSASL
jgi:hypothetical protein